MNYNEIINQLNNNIKKITLSKQEEKKENIPLFMEMYGNPSAEQVDAKDAFYLNKFRDVKNQLKRIRCKFNSNKEFYETVAKQFAQVYIPLMIKEYSIIDNLLVDKLMNIYNGTCIKIFDIGEAQVYAAGFGEKINGDVGAFKYHDMICFTPDNENKYNEVSEEDSIMNAARMLSSMIHETMHLIINVTKNEHFNYNDESILTSGGYILNEGLAEMHALDFAKKYNLIHLPALYYMNNVDLCRKLKLLYGEEKFEEISFNGTYDEMIPQELMEQYQTAERVRYFSRKGYDVNLNQIDLDDTFFACKTI